ncbi:hypothetical protein EOL28_29275, partial [Citrobacter freundii]
MIITNATFIRGSLKVELCGILGDLLNIIHLQTGLDFEPILASSKSEQTKQISGEQWDMYPTITLTHQNPHNST